MAHTSKPLPAGSPLRAERGDGGGRRGGRRCRSPAAAGPLPPPPPGTGAAQMMLAGAKTGVTHSVSAISQPQDSGAQTLSRSSSVCGGFPWKSWTAFLQAGDTRGEQPLPKCCRMGPGNGELRGSPRATAPSAQSELSCLQLPQ